VWLGNSKARHARADAAHPYRTALLRALPRTLLLFLFALPRARHGALPGLARCRLRRAARVVLGEQRCFERVAAG